MIEYVLVDESGVVRQRGRCFSEDEIPEVEGLTSEVVSKGDTRAPDPHPPKSYIMERRIAYPGIGDQLDALWKALGPILEHPEAQAILERIAQVKKSHPKPTNKQ